MKRISLSTLIIITLFSLSSFAQTSTVAIRAGINMGWHKIVQESIYSYKHPVNFLPVISIPVEIPVSSRFSIQPEVSFIMKSARTKLKVQDDYKSVETIRLSYFEGTLLGKLYLKNSTKVKTGFIVGPGFGYGAKGKYIVEVGYPGQTSKRKEDLEFDSGFRRRDFTLNAGMNFIFEQPNGNVIIDIRYQHGLSNNVIGYGFAREKPELKSRGVILSIGYGTKSK